MTMLPQQNQMYDLETGDELIFNMNSRVLEHWRCGKKVRSEPFSLFSNAFPSYYQIKEKVGNIGLGKTIKHKKDVSRFVNGVETLEIYFTVL